MFDASVLPSPVGQVQPGVLSQGHHSVLSQASFGLFTGVPGGGQAGLRPQCWGVHGAQCVQGSG